MPRYNVVPQEIIDEIAPALSSNPNTGRVIAEELLRQDSTGDLVQKLVAGEELTARDRAQLPPLMPGYTWDAIGERIRQQPAVPGVSPES